MQEHDPFVPPPPAQPAAPPRFGNPRLSVLVLLLFGLVFLLALPYLAEQIAYAINRGKARADAEAAREELAQLPDPERRYRSVVKAVTPSVVAVEMVRLIRGRRYRDEWSWLFEPPLGAYGQGSGVIVDEQGYVVTNFHVVNGATEVQVRLNDGRVVRDVRFVGADPASDLAVLKIDAGRLTAAKWGDSDELEVGDPVLAIGAPYGFAETVTAGIVSAKNRRLPDDRLELADFLQTDAAVNPGNSGGPLVNLKGEIVGINTAIYGPRYQGIAFAIPSRLAQDVYEKLKAGQPVPRGYLGVGMDEVTRELAEQLGLDQPGGVVITEVAPGSPAAKAGLQPADVILQWDGKPVNSTQDLRFLVASSKIGSTVKVLLYRDGRKQEVTVTVGQRPARWGRP
ncbi:MAG: S1C family serine protease [Thermoguttaceae bacterium]